MNKEPIYACDRCGDRAGWPDHASSGGKTPFLRADGSARVCATMGDGTPTSECWGRYRIVQPEAPPTGAELIATERRRQIEAEGWTPEHDDRHEEGDIIAAAIAYALAENSKEIIARLTWWPWGVAWWKPSDDPIRNLVKAGALIAAEIDRLQRAADREVER